MSVDEETSFIIAGVGTDGEPCRVDRGSAQVLGMPGVIEAVFLLGSVGIPLLPRSGAVRPARRQRRSPRLSAALDGRLNGGRLR